MIKQLTISNFQSHKKTELSFDDGINVIIGQSDSGKSAIIRALNWVANNKPSGEAFRSKWGGDTKATLSTELHSDYQQTVIRSKEKTKNTYSISDPNGITSFASFGQNVPQEIKELLNFSSLNIASQFYSPFLLAMSGGEVASYLNNIVHLDKIDTSLTNINKTLKDEKTVYTRVKQELEATQIRYAGFDYLEKAEALLIEIEGLNEEVFERSSNLDTLHDVLKSVISCQEELKKYSGVIEAKKLIIEVEELEKERIDKTTRVEGLKATLDYITQCQRELKKYSGVKDCQNDIYAIEKDIIHLDQRQGNLEELKNTLGTLTDIQTDLDWKKMKLEEDKAKFEELMPSTCPLCGRGD